MTPEEQRIAFHDAEGLDTQKILDGPIAASEPELRRVLAFILDECDHESDPRIAKAIERVLNK